jgi:hypothetical protein
MPSSLFANPPSDAAQAARHGFAKPPVKSVPVSVGGDLSVMHNVGCGADLRVGGDLHIGGSVNDARIICAGELQVPNGSIKGGQVSAYRGVTCKMLGDSTGTETDIWIGFDYALIDEINARLPEIQKAFTKAGQFRMLLEPMLKDSHGLTAQQKEQVSDLLFRAGDARRRGQTMVKSLLARLKEAQANAGMQCVVTETAFQKVSISFPGAKVVLESSIDGPVRLTASRGHNGVYISVIHLSTGKSQQLQRSSFFDPMEHVQSTLEKLEKS